MKDSRYYPVRVGRELRRIGVDLERLGGLASDEGAIPPAEFLRWLRTVPGGLGHRAFLRLLETPSDAGGPHVVPPDLPEAPDAATYTDPEYDEALAFLTELDRVVTTESIEGERATFGSAFGFNMPHGRAHALAVLRTLPDGAGPRAFVTALSAAPADFGSESRESAG